MSLLYSLSNASHLMKCLADASHNTTIGPISSTSGAASLFADDMDNLVTNATHRTQSPEPIAHVATPKPSRIACDIDSTSSEAQLQNEPMESMAPDEGRNPTTLGEVIRFALKQASLPVGLKRKPLQGPIDTHKRKYPPSLRSINQPVLVPKSRPKYNNEVIFPPPPTTTTTKRGETSSGGSSSLGPRKGLGTQNPAPAFPRGQEISSHSSHCSHIMAIPSSSYFQRKKKKAHQCHFTATHRNH